MKLSRNDFLRILASSTLVSVGGSSLATTNPGPGSVPPSLRLAMASYTLRKFSLEEVIRVCNQLGISAVALKSMHMPLESPPDEVRSIAAKVRTSGLTLYGAGVIYMKTAQEVEAAFTYAQSAGLEMIIGVPDHSLLPLVEQKVKASDIRLAIHNHGPGDNLYSSPADVYERIKSLDSRIGLCMDVGHVMRIKQDPITMIAKYRDRLFDMHMKDVTAEGKDIEIGRGVIDVPGIIKALRKNKYNGNIALEYEKDEENPVAGLAESVGYLNALIRVI